MDVGKMIAEIDSRFLSWVKVEDEVWKRDAHGLCYRDLNSLLRTLNDGGARRIELHNVQGQRHIGTDLEEKMEIDVYGTPRKRHMAKFVGTVIHGGTMYIRGEVGHLGKEAKVVLLDEEDRRLLRSLVGEF